MADATADDATVFVRGLPFQMTSEVRLCCCGHARAASTARRPRRLRARAQDLEQAFSDVGPIRRSFIIRDKASGESRGFGFVQ
jgi:RNA recognition motif-containing protein